MQSDSGPDMYFKAWTLLNETRHAVYQTVSGELRAAGISPRQAAALISIGSASKPLTPAQLARRMLRERHSVVVMLNRMEQGGLVRKAENAERKQSVLLSLTERGEQKRKAAMRVLKGGSIEQPFSALSEEECRQLMSHLEVLLDRTLKKLGVNERLHLD